VAPVVLVLGPVLLPVRACDMLVLVGCLRHCSRNTSDGSTRRTAGTTPACGDRPVRAVVRAREQGWRFVARGQMWGNWAARQRVGTRAALSPGACTPGNRVVLVFVRASMQAEGRGTHHGAGGAAEAMAVESDRGFWGAHHIRF
jgi:hypothetical protein